MTSSERRLLLLLAAINFTHILDFMIMMPLGNYLLPAFGINASEFAFLVASYNYAAFATGLVASSVVDRYDRKKVLVFGYTGFLLGTLCCALAPGYWLLLASRVVAGLFGGLIGAQVLSIVADTFGYEKRARAMSWLMTAFSFASVLGVPLGLYLARYISWHTPFLFIVILGVVVLLLVVRFVPPVVRHLQAEAPAKSIKATYSQVFSSATQRAGLFFTGMLMLGHFLVIPFINPYLEFNKGFSKSQTPIIYMAGGAITIFSSIIWGRLADRVGKLRIFTIAAMLSVIPILFITNLPNWSFAITLIPFVVWFAMANGRIITSQAMVTQVVPPSSRGSFMSLNSSVQSLFTGMAGTLAGLLVVTGPNNSILRYEWLGYLSVLLILVTVYLARRLKVH